MPKCKTCNDKKQIKEDTLYGDYGSCWEPCPDCCQEQVVRRQNLGIDTKIKRLEEKIKKLQLEKK